MNLVLTGASGRMGQAVLKLLHLFPNLNLVGAVEAAGHPVLGKEVLPGVRFTHDLSIEETDVVLDFTNPDASITNLKAAASLKKPVVIGTTGHSSIQRAHIKASSKVIPIVYSPNMSVGMNLMWMFVEMGARVLEKKEYQIDIVETHHIHKKDAPSGSAKKMLEILAEMGGYDLDKDVFYHLERRISRIGDPSLPLVAQDDRKKSKISVKSIREGEAVGDHTIIFTSPYERLEVTHRAFTREVFAVGALKACEWIYKKKPGLYEMGDVLGINSKHQIPNFK